jgi:hypothetical protein
MAVFEAVYSTEFRVFRFVNRALVSLLRKLDAVEIQEFQPVGLIHILPKFLANHLISDLLRIVGRHQNTPKHKKITRS